MPKRAYLAGKTQFLPRSTNQTDLLNSRLQNFHRKSLRTVSQDKLSKLGQMTIIGVNAISENYECCNNIHLCNFGHQTLESHSHAERNQCKHFSVTLPWVSGLGWDRRGRVEEERRTICQAGIKGCFCSLGTQRKEERNGSVRGSERAVKETTGLLDSHRDKHHHTTSFLFLLLLLFSLSSQSVAVSLLGVSDQCWHSQCSLLQCCLYWEISIPLIAEVCLCTEAWTSILIQRPLCYDKTLSTGAFILLLCTPHASFFQA